MHSKFWKGNVVISILVFSGFLIEVLVLYFDRGSKIHITGLFIVFGTFLEIYQVPVCLLYYIIFFKKQKPSNILWLLLFSIFFIIKVLGYIYFMGGAIERYN